MAIRKIRGKELEPGMILAETIYSDSGQVLYRPGTLLTMQVISRMIRYSRNIQSRWLSIQVNDVCTANPGALPETVRTRPSFQFQDSTSDNPFSSDLFTSDSPEGLSAQGLIDKIVHTSSQASVSSDEEETFAPLGESGRGAIKGLVAARMVGYSGLMRWRAGCRRCEATATVSYLNSEGVVMSGQLGSITPGQRMGFIFRERSVLPKGVHGAIWNLKALRQVAPDSWLFQDLSLETQDRGSSRRGLELKGPDDKPLFMELYVLDWEYPESYTIRNRIDTGTLEQKAGNIQVTQIFDRVTSRMDGQEMRILTERKTVIRGVVKDISEDGMCLEFDSVNAPDLSYLTCNRALKTGLVLPVSQGRYVLMNVMGRPVNLRLEKGKYYLHTQFVRRQKSMVPLFDRISGPAAQERASGSIGSAPLTTFGTFGGVA